jgi:hypothetical protein
VALFKVTDSVEAAVAEVLNFYRVYHSMRYVGNDLVLRLKRPLGEKSLTKIQAEFADILKSGTFVESAALPAEANDVHLLSLPRLKFCFDRHKLGRLRMLIDLINGSEPPA